MPESQAQGDAWQASARLRCEKKDPAMSSLCLEVLLMHFPPFKSFPVDQAEGPPAPSPDDAKLGFCQVMIIVSSLSLSAFCLLEGCPCCERPAQLLRER